MDNLAAKVQDLLNRNIPGSEFHVETAAPEPKIGGFVVAEYFYGMSQRERQRYIWSILRNNLPEEDQQRVTAILTLTPSEREAILENE